ncbi:hypothetical protein N480_05575 [Pseudoalteromonas luteoviolacea S2607]|uniref:hypothetical protein n=1 Tax=Pseudoalteromonas luteoviolacea TaxID=43657 RepID=UPI0007B0B2B6|nr:hypothetical protein [Pseudoalteromonas luteoviolacea]KZN30422.1 hypothetical protein N480_05575 [Pseudoalteromonas luteoviolacea S2607]
MLKTKNFIFVSVLVLFSIQVEADNPNPINIEQRCNIEDRLTFFEAVGRSDWALRCELISVRTHDYFVYDDWGNRRSQVYYPSFYKPSHFSDWFSAPRVKSYSCTSYGHTSYIGCLSDAPFGSTSLLFASGEFAIFDAYTQQVHELVIVDESSTLDSIHLGEANVSIYGEEASISSLSVVKITTQTGSTLTVTPEHPLLLATGKFKAAKYLTNYDEIVSQDGEFESILSVEPLSITAQLYKTDINIQQTTQKHNQNNVIVVTQGYLSGYLFENQHSAKGHRLALRDNIPDSLIF